MLETRLRQLVNLRSRAHLLPRVALGQGGLGVDKPQLHQFAAGLVHGVVVGDLGQGQGFVRQLAVHCRLAPQPQRALQTEGVFIQTLLTGGHPALLQVGAQREFGAAGAQRLCTQVQGFFLCARALHAGTGQERFFDDRFGRQIGLGVGRGHSRQAQQAQQDPAVQQRVCLHDFSPVEAAPKRSKIFGSNSKVSKVELNKPPVTTMAKGR